MPRLAIVQRPPVLLDRAATLDRALGALHEAAEGGAQIVVFPECFVPGYPAWIWRLRAGLDLGLIEKLHARLRANAVNLAADDLAPLRDAARERQLTVICGVQEIDAQFSGGTLYDTAVAIGPDGALLNRHRKLMPTNPERMVWGFGDATGLRAIATSHARLGTLICWENYMPLARAALYAQGMDLLVAPTYDEGERWIATMQHIAREGGCWVAGAGCAFRGRDVPDALPAKAELFPDADAWINAGDSVIVAPGGKIVAGPLHEQHALLYADLDLGRVGAARRSLDVVGHYGRPDVFRLHVNRKPMPPVEFDDGDDAG